MTKNRERTTVETVADTSVLDSPKDHSAWPWVSLRAPGGLSAPAEAEEGAPPTGWPRITVVILADSTLLACERAIRSVLAQAYPNFECLAVTVESDDARRDDGACRDLICRYQPWLSPVDVGERRRRPAAINAALATASGEVVTFLSGGDVHMPWALRCVGRIFAEFAEVSWLAGCPAEAADGVINAVQRPIPYPRQLIRAGAFHPGLGGWGWVAEGCTFWRRQLWKRVGGFDETLKGAVDYELAMRCAEHADLYVTSTILGARGAVAARSVPVPTDASNEVRAVSRRPRDGRQPAGLALYRRVRGWRYASRIVRRVWRLDRLVGPILQWDFQSRRYVVQHRPFLS
jgi:hypothetical protein